MSKFQNIGGAIAPKCFICDKTVYKAEEVAALGRYFHKMCFTCGGTLDDGCKKSLTLNNYLSHNDQPYCTNCHKKISRPRSVVIEVDKKDESNGSNAESGEVTPSTKSVAAIMAMLKEFGASESSHDTETSIPNTTRKISVASISPKCTICEKSVYKVEEVQACGKVYHKTCFVCSGAVGDGCKRVLSISKYQVHDNDPYCESCYGRLFRPKGFGFGTNIATDFGKSGEEEVSHAREILSTDENTATDELNQSSVVNTARKLSTATSSSTTTRKLTIGGALSPKCTLCSKTVYKVEEVNAVDRFWHKTCFICSGSAGDGCKRVLTLDKYLVHENDPYCNSCYSKLFKPKGFGYGNNLATDYGKIEESGQSIAAAAETLLNSDETPDVDNSLPPPTKPSAISQANSGGRKLSIGAALSPKCVICTKTVYKMEEVNAVDKIWHKTCFTCGGGKGEGCQRILTLDKYLVHNNEPFCNSCYGKLFKPKGFGFGGNLVTDYGKSGDEEVLNARVALSTE